MVVPVINSPVSAFTLWFNTSNRVVSAKEFLEMKAILSPLFTVMVKSLNKVLPSIDFDKLLMDKI